MAARVGRVVSRMWCLSKSAAHISAPAGSSSSASVAGGRSVPRFSPRCAPQQQQQDMLFSSRRHTQYSAIPGEVRCIFSMMPRHDANATARLVSKLSSDLCPDLEGFLSADEEREQLFISDTNRHRVIVVDASGKILDCIGSVPGFEDGTFERARLCQPSSTVFDQHHDCLYIADSKNHVIRRANMSKRSVDTLGRSVEHDGSPMWSRFSKWLQGATQGTRKEEQLTSASESDSVLKDPCHLKLASDGSLLVARSAAVYEEFKKRSGATDPPPDTFSSLHAEPDRLVSRVAKTRDSLFYLDAEDHIVRKMDLQTGRSSTLELSRFGCLGLPAWWSIHPLSLLNVDSKDSGLAADSTQEDEMASTEIRVRPGRCLLCIEPLLPERMTLAAPVEDGSVWRQARGSIVELSAFGGRLRSHKVSGAQQWVDDLEESETDSEVFEELVGPQQSEHKLPLYSFFDASLGSGEVLVDAVLYLKPANSGSSQVSSVVNSNATEKPSGEKGVMGGQGDRLRLKKLHVRVRIEVTDTACDERTHVISVRV
ncbi:hypothetical protein R1sor_021346 [Riccia sorocarpa]|uniref:NHL repeat-containing protein 2 n=1 Tax=Riccia sorocarpa TaxID=122646 RepID=A0ABD3GGT7_9MARC